MRRIFLALAAALAAACGPGSPPEALPDVTLAELRQLTGVSVDSPGAAAPYESADAERGRKLFGQCLVCHALAASEGPRQGPHLAEIWGRQTASQAGFAYSDALLNAQFVWGVQAMDAWIANPLGLIQGSQMSFAGLHAARDRRDLIAYMLTDERFFTP